MKKPGTSSVVCLVLAVYGSAAQGAEEEKEEAFGTIGGSMLLATNYMFRSISNSNNGPQVNGDLNWSHDSGFYIGIWASNTDFGGAGNSMELDPYIGIAGDIGETNFSYDIGYWSYNYPKSELDLDYAEFYVTPSYSICNFTISPSFWYADNYFGKDFLDGVWALAYEVTVSAESQRDISLSVRVGEQTFESDFDELDYTYWDLGISKNWRDFTFDLRWYDTDGINPFLANPKLANGDIVFSIKRNF